MKRAILVLLVACGGTVDVPPCDAGNHDADASTDTDAACMVLACNGAWVPCDRPLMCSPSAPCACKDGGP